MVLDDAEVAAEAAPTNNGLLEEGLSPRTSVFGGARVAMKAAPAISSLWFSMTLRSRLKPLLHQNGVAAEAAPTNNGLLEEGLLPRTSVFDGTGVAMKAAPATSSLWFSMTLRSRLKPLLQQNGVAAEAAPTVETAASG